MVYLCSIEDLFFKNIYFFVEHSYHIIAVLSVLMVPPVLTLIQQKKNLPFFTKIHLLETYSWKEFKKYLLCFVLYFICFFMPLKDHPVVFFNFLLFLKFFLILFSIFKISYLVGTLYFHLANIFFFRSYDYNNKYYFNKFKEKIKSQEKEFLNTKNEKKESFNNLKTRFKDICRTHFSDKNTYMYDEELSISSEKGAHQLNENILNVFFEKIKKEGFKVKYFFSDESISFFQNGDYYVVLKLLFKKGEDLKGKKESFDAGFKNCFKKDLPYRVESKVKRILLDELKDSYYHMIDLAENKKNLQLVKEINLMREIIRSDDYHFIFENNFISWKTNWLILFSVIFSKENLNFHPSIKEEFFELWIDLFAHVGVKSGIHIIIILDTLASSFDSGFFNKKIVSKRYLTSIIEDYLYADINISESLKEETYNHYSYFNFLQALRKTGENKREDFGFDFFVDLALTPLLMKYRLEEELGSNDKKVRRLDSLDKILNSIAIQFSSYCLNKGIDEFDFDIKRSIYKLINKNKIIHYIEEIIEKDEEIAHKWDISLKMERAGKNVASSSPLDFYRFLLKGFLKDYFTYHATVGSGIYFLKEQNIPSDMKNKLNRDNIDDLINKLMEQFKANLRKQPKFR